MTNVFITGTNRGIGLELARQFAMQPEMYVFAAARQPSDELNALLQQFTDRMTFIPLEVTDQAQIDQAVQQVAGAAGSLDILLNNAGMSPSGQSLEQITPEKMIQTFTVNSVAPLMLTRTFLPLLKKGQHPRVMNVSTQVGSMQWKTSGGSYAYGTSKAALNLITRSLAADLRGYGITVITLHPGWVQTDMGGSSAPLTTEESAQGILALAKRITLEDTGKFFKWNGEIHPW